MAVAGNYAYVADGLNGGLVIVDVTNPAAPTLKGSFDTYGYSEGVAVVGNYAYVADGENGLEIFRIDTASNSRVHNINKGTNYTTIQTAINDSSLGDEIRVDSGTYYENVNVTKRLTLRGIGMPVINASGSGDPITLVADGIVLEGFNATGSGVTMSAGIKVTSSSNTLNGNNAYSNQLGFYLTSASNNTLSGNTASNNRIYGIRLDTSSNNTLNVNNVRSNKYFGMYLESSSNNTLSGNIFIKDGILIYDSFLNRMEYNTVNGKPLIYLENVSDYRVIDAGQVIVVNSKNITVENLDLSNTCFGIELWMTDNSKIINNNISNNLDGIYMTSSNNNTFRGNNASNNRNDGIFITSSNNNTLSVNNVRSNNNHGMVLSSSSNNKIYHNNLVNNTNQAYDDSNANPWYSAYPSGGNYYSDYTGSDIKSGSSQNIPGSDGIGDTPYDISGGGAVQDRYPLMAPYQLVTENKNPDQPTGLNQLKSDEKTQINIGEIADRSKVVFNAKVNDPDGDKVKLQVELRRLDEYGGNFDETKGGLKESDLVASGSTVTAYAVDLIDGSYHWRARTIDEHGNKSEWVSFGGNPDSSADFIVRGFRFVQLSDTHIGPDPECWRKYPNILGDNFNNCISDSYINSFINFGQVKDDIIRKYRPDFIIVTGDSVEWNNINLFDDLNMYLDDFRMSSIDVYTVPGNHDRRGVENPITILDTFLPQNNLDNYKKYLGSKVINGVQGDYSNGNYYFDSNNYRFIGLDSGYDIMSKDITDNPKGSGLSNNQIDLIKNNAIFGKTFIFMHHPAMDDDNSLNVVSENREQFVNLAKEKNVKSVLTGHTHYSKFFKTTGPTWYIQTRSAAKDTYNENLLVSLRGYLIVDVGKDITDINKIQLQDVQMSGAESEPVTTITIFSPVDLHVYDEFGRHTGLNSSGGIEINIPDTYYLKDSKMGNITLPASVLLYNNTLNYSFKIVSNFSKENVTGDHSSFNFTIEQRTGDTIKTINYNNVSINRNSIAHLKLNTTQANYTMQVDLNNDSIMDTTKAPDTIITDHAPTVTILSPTNGSIRDQVQPITFNGKGIDLEDGILTKLTWISDRDDVIGHGNFTTSNLSAGIHQITLLVKDTAGQVNTSNLILTIKDTKAPVLDIQYPTINKIFNKQDITVKGIASDDSGISNVTVNGIKAGKEEWNTVLTLNEGENKIEVVATDNKGFTTTTNRTVYYNSSLASDTQPPATITNVTNKTGYDNLTGAWINWTWDNPKDQDFSYAIVYLDNIPMGNTSKSYFNFTGLSSDADYNVSILTADIVDNINQMWVNASARTATSASTPTPIVGTKGEVNGDGQISVVDALFIAQYTVGTRTLTSTQLAAADVNGDGLVTIVDALFIAQYTVGLRTL